MKIGLISDTHGFLDERVFHHFEVCDEVWHAGDIGSVAVADALEGFKPFKAVYGNIDSNKLRIRYPKDNRFEIEGMRVWMTHIGGYPPKYNAAVRDELKSSPPDIFIAGHSHILRVISDPNLNNLLYLNPGAAGRQGFHKVRTLLRFAIINQKVKDMQVIELGKRA